MMSYPNRGYPSYEDNPNLLPLVQPLVDAFRSEDKDVDTELDSVDASADKAQDNGKRMNLDEKWEQIYIGPLNHQEKADLKNIIKEKVEAFAASDDDIGSFTGFPYESRYKKDADPH